MIGIALIGMGRIGREHFNNLNKTHRAKVLYVVDINIKAVQEYISKLKSDVTTLHEKDVAIALEDKRIDAVLVCTPTSSHSKFIKLALNAGKSVMSEKPLSLDVNEVVECYELAKQLNQVLFCGFNRIFDPSISSFERMIKNHVGKVKSIKITSRDHPRNSIDYLVNSGGMIIDQCIHDIHMLRHFAEENPDTIYAMAHAHFDDIGNIGDVDQLFLCFKFPGGSMGHVDACREATYGHDQRIEIFGSKGMLQSENPRQFQYQITSHQGNLVPDLHRDLIMRYTLSYQAEIEHFLNVIQGKENIKVTGSDTVWVTLLCYAAQESMIGRRNVNVNEFVRDRFKDIREKINSWKENQNSNEQIIN